MADVETVIVGGGISGICLAVQLKKAGRSSFIVVEKSGEVGGTWSLNKYPGCACDVPSYLYSFSFFPYPSWSKFYAERHEIDDYLKACVESNGILPHFRFHTLFRSAAWDESAALWRLEVQDVISSEAYSISAKFLAQASGGLHIPRYPSIKGVEQFAGTSLHTSQWDGSIDLNEKVVALIGTGSSATQVAPAIAAVAKKLYVCQRSPGWIMPKPDFSICNKCKQLLKLLPCFVRLFFWIILLMHEVLVRAYVGGERWRKCLEFVSRRHMKSSVKDENMRISLSPNYKIGCKRVVLSNTYYPTLCRPNVELKTYPILEIHKHGITLGTASLGVSEFVDVDVIVYGTGFDTANSGLDVTGPAGLKLAEVTHASMLGTTKHGFPNFFMVLGPNTGVSYTSAIIIVEAQTRYIISCMSLLTPATRCLEVCAESQQKHQDLLAKKFSKSVWQPGGCHSAYLHPKSGINFYIWPGSCIEFICRSRRANPSDYILR